MNLFVSHQIYSTDPKRLVIKAIRAPGLGFTEIECEKIDGPKLSGWPTNWWHWKIKENSVDGIIPSILNEGCPEDSPYLVRQGIAAMVIEHTVGYVSSREPKETQSDKALVSFIERSAQHPFFKP